MLNLSFTFISEVLNSQISPKLVKIILSHQSFLITHFTHLNVVSYFNIKIAKLLIYYGQPAYLFHQKKGRLWYYYWTNFQIRTYVRHQWRFTLKILSLCVINFVIVLEFLLELNSWNPQTEPLEKRCELDGF